MKNRVKNLKRKRDILKDYVKNKLKNWKHKSSKPPVANK